MITIGAGMLGCNALAGIHEGVFDRCVEDAGNPGCAPGGNSSSSSSDGSTSAGATSSGTGGARPTCGNGLLDSDEECDDKNTKGGDGCTSCKVDCSEPNAVKDDESFHCYWAMSSKMSFLQSSVTCKSVAGGQLATVTSQHELDVITSQFSGPAWIGASDLGPGGALEWLDKEPWNFVSWAPGEPSEGSKDHCVVLQGEPLLFGMSDCNLVQKALCERAPVVTP